RLGQADPVRGVQNTVDHERRRTKVRGDSQLRIAGRESGINGRTPPRDVKLRDVGLVDLIERRVLRAAGVAVVASPLTGFGAVLGGYDRGTDPNGDRHRCQESTSTHHVLL